tara:strand:+ start:5020 stop:6876 length:1857 start_codon:yes stop_codon:yes gene_type:complete
MIPIILLMIIAVSYDITSDESLKILLQYINIFVATIVIIFITVFIYFAFLLISTGLNRISSNITSKIISVGIVTLLYFKSIKLVLILPLFYLISSTTKIIVRNLERPNWEGKEIDISSSSPDSFPMSRANSNFDYSKGYNDGFYDGYEIINVDNNQTTDHILTFFSKVGLIIATYFKDIFLAFSTNFMNAISGHDYSNIKHGILGILLLFVIAKICDNLQFDSIGKNYLNSWIIRNKSNLLFLSIFILGGFLSIASIIAIPIFEQGNFNEGLTYDDFKNKTDLILKQYEDISYINDQEVNSDDFTPFKNYFSNFLIELDSINGSHKDSLYLDNNKANLKNAASAVMIGIDNFLNRNKNLETLTLGLKDKFINDLKTEIVKVETIYENTQNEVAIGNARIVYYNKCLNYLIQYGSNYSSAIQSYTDVINTTIKRNAEELDVIKNEFKINLEYLKEGFNGPIRVPFIYLSTYPYWNDYYFIPNYEVPIFGESTLNLGFFGILANWLINTQSKEMILISGMLGFGLLGAGISSIIRDRNRSSNINPLFKDDVSSTLVGGVSASLVIFLSAKGGTEIISDGNIDLNMYTLLFLCLIGAVFSEAIWERAYLQMNKNNQDNVPQ